MSSFNTRQTLPYIPNNLSILPSSRFALALSLSLQVPAFSFLLLGKLTAGAICIYAVVILGLFYGIIKRDYLSALTIFISSYGLSLPFRDIAAIGFSTYYYAYILIGFFIFIGRNSKSLMKFLPIILVFLMYWLSWTWGTKPMPYGLTIRMAGATAGMLITYLAVSKIEDLRYLVWAMLLGSALFIPTVLLFQNPEERFGVLQLVDNIDAGNPVSYMGHIAPWVIIGFALLVWDNKLKYKTILMAALVILFSIVVISTSRTNIIFIGIGVMPIIIRALHKRPVFIFILLSIIMIGSTIVVIRNPLVYHYLIGRLPLSPSQKGHIAQKAEPGKALREIDKYSQGRIFLMQKGIETFSRYPLFGVGLGNSDATFSTGKPQVIHSFWVKLLAESGLLATLPLLIILFWQFIQYIWRRNGCLPGLSRGLVLGMTFYGLVAHGLDLVMWPTYGLALAVAEMQDKNMIISE